MGFGEQHWLTPSGNLPPARKSCGGVEVFSNSSVVALHWDLVKAKILIKGCQDLDMQGDLLWHFRCYHKRKKELCTKGGDWVTENIGRPGQLDTLSMISDCHHQLVCLSFPLRCHQQRQLPTMSSTDKMEHWRWKPAALLCLGHRFWCIVLKESHTCAMVVATGGTDTGKRKMYTVYRFSHKSVAKGREHQSNQEKCLNFLLHLSW